MTKNRKISTEEFNFLVSEFGTITIDKKTKKEIKFLMLDEIIKRFGDSWYNLKEATRNAIDYICFLSAEKGFFYAKPENIARKNKIGESTIQTALKKLRDIGILQKVNRHSRKQNGLGSPIHFFTVHSNFKRISDFLKLNKKAEKKASEKAEILTNPTESKDTGDLNSPTYSLPSSLPIIKDMNKHNNVSKAHSDTNESESINSQGDNSIKENDVADSMYKLLQDKIDAFNNSIDNDSIVDTRNKKIIKYVPKEINERFSYFGDMLTSIWRKIRQASKRVNFELTNSDVIKIGINVIENLKANPRFKYMTEDEHCAYAYKGFINAVYNHIGGLFIEGMVIDDLHDCYMYEDIYGNLFSTNTGLYSLEQEIERCICYGLLNKGSYPEVARFILNPDEFNDYMEESRIFFL